MSAITEILQKAAVGQGLADHEALVLADYTDTDALLRHASVVRDLSHPNAMSYSRKVFIPLTPSLSRCVPLLHLCAGPSKTKSPVLNARRGA